MFSTSVIGEVWPVNAFGLNTDDSSQIHQHNGSDNTLTILMSIPVFKQS